MTSAPPIRFSVIIPTHNRRSRIGRAIDSVLRGHWPVDQLIVVDDGSTDGSHRVLSAYSRPVEVLRSKVNRGVAWARNAGLRAARCEWVALLDSDDVWLEDHLSCLAEYLQAHPQCWVVQTRERWIRHGRRVNPRSRQVPRAGDIFVPSLQLCLVSSSAVALRRDLLQRVGAYDERLPVCEDYDLWLRIARTHRFGLIQQETIEKDGPRCDQLSQRFWGMDRFRVFSLVKLLSNGLTEQQEAETKKVVLKKLGILAQGANRRSKADAARAYQRWAEAVEGNSRQISALSDPSPGLPRLLVEAGFGPGDWKSDPILSALLPSSGQCQPTGLGCTQASG